MANRKTFKGLKNPAKFEEIQSWALKPGDIILYTGDGESGYWREVFEITEIECPYASTSPLIGNHIIEKGRVITWEDHRIHHVDITALKMIRE